MPQEESSVDVEKEREGRLVSRIVDSAPSWIGRVPRLNKRGDKFSKNCLKGYILWRHVLLLPNIFTLVKWYYP